MEFVRVSSWFIPISSVLASSLSFMQVLRIVRVSIVKAQIRVRASFRAHSSNISRLTTEKMRELSLFTKSKWYPSKIKYQKSVFFVIKMGNKSHWLNQDEKEVLEGTSYGNMEIFVFTLGKHAIWNVWHFGYFGNIDYWESGIKFCRKSKRIPILYKLFVD